MLPLSDLATQLLRGGGRLRMKARGGSMRPFLRDGDVVLVAPAPASEVGVGDVICYATPGRLFLHRAVARDGQRVVAKGDALRFTDLVEPGQVLGRVVAVERHGRQKRLDTPTARGVSRAIAAMSPLLPRLVDVAHGVRRLWRAAHRG